MLGARRRPYVDMVKPGNNADARPGRNPKGRGALGAFLCREPLQYRHIAAGSPPRTASHIASVAHVPTIEIGSSTISVNLTGPGHILRYQQPGAAERTVFHVGEPHGGVSARAQELAAILGAVDTSKVTTNLWGERWTKLAANAITHGLLGATGLDNRAVFVERGRMHRLGVRLAAEAVAVGRAQGYRLGSILGIEPDAWLGAAHRDRDAVARVHDGLASYMATLTQPSRSSVGRDIERGRRSEIDYTNGMVAAKGEATGVPAPTHAAVTELVRRIDRGELAPAPANIAEIPD